MGETCSFELITDGTVSKKTIRCRCIGPDNTVASIGITLTNSKTYKVSITPQIVGSHVLQLEADQYPIKSSPYIIQVKDIDINSIESVQLSGTAFQSNLLGNCVY